jgi:hypothetical protein
VSVSGEGRLEHVGDRGGGWYWFGFCGVLVV